MTQEKERKPGHFYHVKKDDRWIAAEWDDGNWYLPGISAVYEDSDFQEIDETPITRSKEPESQPKTLANLREQALMFLESTSDHLLKDLKEHNLRNIVLTSMAHFTYMTRNDGLKEPETKTDHIQ